ncbi:MAG: hypothetical protein JWN84_1367 [Nocardioides sp.]|nr:hypothetical protein [Nocardioides sp.]
MIALDVRGVGYADASTTLGDANRWAAFRADELSEALASSGAMAGDSSFASEFAAAYDEAAAAVVAALDDVVGGLGSLCRLAYCSLENHDRAERSSIASTIVVSTEPSPASDDLYESASPVPPSSLGGDGSFLPGWANVVLDHVEGFVWPDADVDRLRGTAVAWRSAAAGLDRPVELTRRAVGALLQERSPEIFIATDAVADLGTCIREVAAACEQLGTVCDDYATAVETQRQLILDLVSDLVRDAVLIAAAGFVLGLVTGGSANAVAAWISSGKLAAEVPRFRAFVEALRLYGAGAAAGLRTTSSGAVRVRADLARFVQARRVYMGERGAVSLGKPMTWLRTHEGGPMGAHTLAKHVGKSNRYLRRRLANEPRRTFVSTFTDERTAERSIRSLLKTRSSEIDNWLKAHPNVPRRRFRASMADDVGRTMNRAGEVVPSRNVLVVLVRDKSMPDGFRIFTSYVE